MTADTPNPKSPKNPSLIILTALFLGNVGGLYYLYQQHQQDMTFVQNILKNNALATKNFKVAIADQIQQQTLIKSEILQIKQNISQQALEKHDDSLLKIEWLLQQAQWQLNVLKQPRYAKSYLKQAAKLANHLGFHDIVDSIHHDLTHLKQENITPTHQILDIILDLQQLLDTLGNLNLQTTTEPSTTDINNIHPRLQTITNLLKPFIKIEHYHQTPTKILTPDDKIVVLQNLKLILAEIQYAALSGQQHVFQQLTATFEQEAKILDDKDRLDANIDKLKAIHLGLEKPFHLSSLSMTQQLIKESKV